MIGFISRFAVSKCVSVTFIVGEKLITTNESLVATEQRQRSLTPVAFTPLNKSHITLNSCSSGLSIYVFNGAGSDRATDFVKQNFIDYAD